MSPADWTDARIGEKMRSIDSTFDMLRDEIRGLREDNREQFAAIQQQFLTSNQQFGALHASLHDDLRDLRGGFSALQGRLVQVGFGLVGVLLAAMIALIVAVA